MCSSDLATATLTCIYKESEVMFQHQLSLFGMINLQMHEVKQQNLTNLAYLLKYSDTSSEVANVEAWQFKINKSIMANTLS